MFFRHPFHHQDGSSSETWMGIIDGIYAIAATLIAIELPELFKSLLEAPVSSFRGDALFLMLAYEVTAYAATFLLLYELWLMHRTAIGLGGLKFQIQNICNALILASPVLVREMFLFWTARQTLRSKFRDGATHQDSTRPGSVVIQSTAFRHSFWWPCHSFLLLSLHVHAQTIVSLLSFGKSQWAR